MAISLWRVLRSALPLVTVSYYNPGELTRDLISVREVGLVNRAPWRLSLCRPKGRPAPSASSPPFRVRAPGFGRSRVYLPLYDSARRRRTTTPTSPVERGDGVSRPLLVVVALQQLLQPPLVHGLACAFALFEPE